jgi:hypothetical protein
VAEDEWHGNYIGVEKLIEQLTVRDQLLVSGYQGPGTIVPPRIFWTL